MRRTSLALLSLLCFSLVGCVDLFTPHKRADRSSSIVDYLYPNQAEPLITPQVPVLNLPLHVGVAFAPSSGESSDFTPEQQAVLLKRVADAFRNRPFVKSIEVLPTSYLRPQGSFENLDQIRRMMGIDVIVLVAYDQTQFANLKTLSLSYWTIVGAYVFHGNRDDTHTLIEAAVYDIASRSLLFRAPGVDQTHSSSTAIASSEQRRADSAHSFELAIDDLTRNLNTALDQFRADVKSGAANVKVVSRPGYSGGGAFEGWFALLLAGLAFAASRMKRS